MQLDVGVLAIKAALAHLETEEAQQFLDDFFLRIVQMSTNMRFKYLIILSSFSIYNLSIISISPSKLPMTDKVQIEDLLVQTLSILLKTIGKDSKFLPVLARIFDPSIPYYHGKLYFILHSMIPSGTFLAAFQVRKWGILLQLVCPT